MRVINLGSLNLDYSYRVPRFVRPGETMEADSFSLKAGGKGLNQSIAAAKAGLEVYQAGCVGPDSALLFEELEQNGVDTSLIQTGADATGHAIIQVAASGENSILIYGGANRTLTLEYINSVLAHFAPGDVLLLQNEINLVPEIIFEADRRGLRIAFNAAPLTSDVKTYPLDKLSWLMVNEVEGEALTGETDHLAIIKQLRLSYPQTMPVLTVGAAGALTADSENMYTLSAYPLQPVDTTAAGDTFNGYFLSAVLADYPLPKALEFATAASALCVLNQGAAVSVPRREQVLAFMQENPPATLTAEVIPFPIRG